MFFSLIASYFSHFFCLILGIGSEGNFPPPLSAKEEKRLFLLKGGGDETARKTLIEHNLRLVSHMVRKYYASYPMEDELISVGSLGLIKAVDTFQTENGARFATYAAKCIQNEILMFFRSGKKLQNEVSLHETIDVDRDGNPLTYGDILATEDKTEDRMDARFLSEKAYAALQSALGEREKEIIVLRYGLGSLPPKTQRETAELLHISRSYVSRIEKKALAAMKETFGDTVPDLDSFST